MALSFGYLGSVASVDAQIISDAASDDVPPSVKLFYGTL